MALMLQDIESTEFPSCSSPRSSEAKKSEDPRTPRARTVAVPIPRTETGSKKPVVFIREQKPIDLLYEMKTEIGKGNFAVVYRGIRRDHAAEEGTQEEYAIKCIDRAKFEKFLKSRKTTLNIDSEQKMLRQLNHPNIVKFCEIIAEADKLYLVTEFLAGSDMTRKLLDYGAFPKSTTKRIFSDILQALRYLHDKSIVHRDLKTDNILLTSTKDDAVAKIADFGLARYVEQKKADASLAGTTCIESFGRATTFCGTPQYFAPEIIKTQRGELSGYGTKADMWAAGVVLYVLLSLTPPFEDAGLYEQITEAEYSFDEAEWEVVDVDAKDLVRALMETNVERRLSAEQALFHRWLLAACPEKTWMASS